MDARTQCEVNQLNNEYQMRIPEKAIIEFIGDYSPNAAEKLMELNGYWGTDTVTSLINCIKIASRKVKEQKNDQRRDSWRD